MKKKLYLFLFLSIFRIFAKADVEIITEKNKENDLLEIMKIVLLTTTSSILYGVVHDLITVNICFEYFNSDLTHHGPYTKKYFPEIYRKNNKILYALLWGTIATYWVGIILGIICGISARCNSQKITWRNLLIPCIIFSSTLLISTLIFGLVTYSNSKNNFLTANYMHNWSYFAGGVLGLIFTFYVLNMKNNKIVTIEKNIINFNLINFF
jgi:hypothetical protein